MAAKKQKSTSLIQFLKFVLGFGFAFFVLVGILSLFHDPLSEDDREAYEALIEGINKSGKYEDAYGSWSEVDSVTYPAQNTYKFRVNIRHTQNTLLWKSRVSAVVVKLSEGKYLVDSIKQINYIDADSANRARRRTEELAKRKANQRQHQRQRAFECHLSTVTSNLLAPSTAEFPYYEEVPIIWLDSSLYHIRGYVDAQNAFGAMIRINYDCEVWAEPYCQVRSFKLIE